MFSGHSLKSKILYRLPFKTKVKVIKQVGSWSQIKIKFGQKYSNYGWVRSKYLVIN
ncbi:SH3 domain-containing protein [Lentilactobacillus otakiensis]|uniref:SH3 domain-containing protein n=1 Tax=Lentilactobacillus otakiensis TaxID=481720 RepID=UPI003D175188